MRIAINAPQAETAIIRELLSPWHVSYVGSDEADISISYGTKCDQSDRTILIPSYPPDLIESSQGSKPKLSCMHACTDGRRIQVSVDTNSALEITPKALYCASSSGKRASDADSSSTKGLNCELLSTDVVAECSSIINRTINAKQSLSFRALTRMPFSYSIVPSGFKKQLLRKPGIKPSLTLNDKLSLDALRFILLEAIERIVKRSLQKKTWNGKKFSVLLTHDVETRDGLTKARHLKKLEDRYDVQSAWFIPSKRYELEPQIIQDLANHGEVGSHDTKHDGKLAILPRQKMVRRISEAKTTLEKITHQSVGGFRAPLLQHNTNLIAALRESNYVYDSSIPTWEPNHPSTMKPHGIETVYPLTVNGLIEIPITLPQDHQLLYVLDLDPNEVVREWLKAACLIKRMGGLCTFLVHPEYKLADGKMETYEELLNLLVSDEEASITLPTEIARSHGDNLSTN